MIPSLATVGLIRLIFPSVITRLSAECDNDGCYYYEYSVDRIKKSRLRSNVPSERYQMIVKRILSSHQFISLPLSLCAHADVPVYIRLPFVLIEFFFI